MIKHDINKLNNEFTKIKWNSISKEDLIKNIVKLFSKLWQIHPFQEGNTRSVSILMFIFADGFGLNLNNEFIKNHAKYFRNALVMASIGEYSEFNYLENFLNDALILKK